MIAGSYGTSAANCSLRMLKSGVLRIDRLQFHAERRRYRLIAANWATPVDKEASRRTATVTLSRNYVHRSMARRTRIEYSATHMMSEAQPRLSSTACSLMVNSPWRSNAMGPPPSHSQPATKRMDRSLGQT